MANPWTNAFTVDRHTAIEDYHVSYLPLGLFDYAQTEKNLSPRQECKSVHPLPHSGASASCDQCSPTQKFKGLSLRKLSTLAKG